MQVFKEGGHRLFQSDPECAEIVSGMLADLEKNGMDAVRQYSKKFDAWSPADFELSPAQVESAIAAVDSRVIQDTDFCQAQCARVCPGANGHPASARGGNAAGHHSGAQAHSHEIGGELHSRRALPDVRVGADEHHSRQGGGGEKRLRLYSAGERAGIFPGHGQCHEEGRARTASSSWAEFPRSP